MLTIVLVGAVSALAIFAILLKLSAPQPKKAERTEKGEIIKQLLALSELETGSAKTTSRSAAPPPPPKSLPGKPTDKKVTAKAASASS